MSNQLNKTYPTFTNARTGEKWSTPTKDAELKSIVEKLDHITNAVGQLTEALVEQLGIGIVIKELIPVMDKLYWLIKMYQN